MISPARVRFGARPARAGNPCPVHGLGPGPASIHAERHPEVDRGRGRPQGDVPHLRPQGRARSPSPATSARAARWTKDDTGRLVDHRRPADPRLLQLHVQRRRRAHRRPEERDDQAGPQQPRQHVPRAGRGGRVRDDQGRAARRGPRRLVSLGHARHAAPDARLHAPGLRGRHGQVSGPLPAARRRRRGLGLEHDRPRRLHPRQPDRGRRRRCRCSW